MSLKKSKALHFREASSDTRPRTKAQSGREFRFSLYGQPVDVTYRSKVDWSSDTMGETNSRTWTINLADDLPPQVEGNTLLHEIIHLITDTHDVEISEQAVDLLANGLLDVLLHNPDVRAKILTTAKGEDCR